MHTVAALALPDVIAFDLATAVEVFGRASLPDGRPAYRVIVAGTSPTVDAGPLQITTHAGLDALTQAVCARALADASDWQRQGLGLSVAINVSMDWAGRMPGRGAWKELMASVSHGFHDLSPSRACSPRAAGRAYSPCTMALPIPPRRTAS